jgi:hypothetical protein
MRERAWLWLRCDRRSRPQEARRETRSNLCGHPSLSLMGRRISCSMVEGRGSIQAKISTVRRIAQLGQPLQVRTAGAVTADGTACFG